MRHVLPFLPSAYLSLFTAWVKHICGAVGSEFSLPLSTVPDRRQGGLVYLYKLFWPRINLIYRAGTSMPLLMALPVSRRSIIVAALFWKLRNRSRTPLRYCFIYGIAFSRVRFFHLYTSVTLCRRPFSYLPSIGPIAARRLYHKERLL